MHVSYRKNLILLYFVCISFFASLSFAQEDTARFVEGEIIIKFKSGFDSPSVASFLENQNLLLLSTITADRWALIGFDKNSDVASKLQTLKNLPIVEWVQPNYIYKLCTNPNDPHFLDSSLWSLHDLGQTRTCGTHTFQCSTLWGKRFGP